jgi:hypothetical protein
MLWAWPTTMLMVVAIMWTALAASSRVGSSGSGESTLPFVGPRRARVPHAAAGVLVAVVGVVALASSVLDATDVEPPEAHLSDTLGALVEPTERALLLGTGAADGGDGTYLVTFEDALHFGSQAYGLVNELERRGIDAGMDDYRRVPVRPHRVVDPADATAQVALVSGQFVEQWRARPDAQEIATWVPTAEAQARFHALKAEATARLSAEGLDDLVPLLTTNLFGIQLDERADEALQRQVDEMLRIGQPTSVFVAPATAGP